MRPARLNCTRPLFAHAAMDDANNIYYLFSTAAQSIAAFIGLLIAGYALVLSMMDAAVRADDTLEEVFAELKRQFHRMLTVLSIVTAAGIIGSFIVLFLNKYHYSWFPYLAALVFVADCASVAGGVWFVIKIIDPAKYRAVAKQLAREIEPPSQAPTSVSRGAFLVLFIEIEQRVRKIWIAKTDGQRLGQRQAMPSFREMLEILSTRGIIDQDLYGHLLSVSKHRNVVVHGQVDFVNPDVFREAELARNRLIDIGNGGEQTA
jgi:hypothetical protein